MTDKLRREAAYMDRHYDSDGSLVVYGDSPPEAYRSPSVLTIPQGPPDYVSEASPQHVSPRDYRGERLPQLPEQPEQPEQPEPVKPAEEEGRKKKRKLHPLLKGITILAVGPFVMAGAVVVAFGGFIYGSGQIIVGVGDILTGGPLKKKAKEAWKARKDSGATTA